MKRVVRVAGITSAAAALGIAADRLLLAARGHPRFWTLEHGEGRDIP